MQSRPASLRTGRGISAAGGERLATRKAAPRGKLGELVAQFFDPRLEAGNLGPFGLAHGFSVTDKRYIPSADMLGCAGKSITSREVEMQKVDDDPDSWSFGLTLREVRFVQEFLVDLHAGAAAQRAGLGRSKKACVELASRMRRKQSVALAISKLLAERSGSTQSRLIEELGKMALCDITDYAKVVGGRLVVTDTADLTPDQRAAIVGIKETINEKGHSTIEYKFDKLAAIDRLARAVSLYKDRTEISGPKGGPVQVVDMTDAKSRLMQLLNLHAVSVQPMPMVQVDPPIRRIAAPVRQPVRVIDAD